MKTKNILIRSIITLKNGRRCSYERKKQGLEKRRMDKKREGLKRERNEEMKEGREEGIKDEERMDRRLERRKE